MSDPKIVASAKNQVHPGSVPRDSSRSWLVLGWIGLVFLVVGGFDFLLLWLPLDLGNAEWEFATVTQSFNGLPILLLGFALLTVAAEASDRRWWQLIGLGGSMVMLLWILVGAVLWGLNVSIALGTVPPEIEVGIRRAVAKTAVQSLAYTLAFGYLMRYGWVARKGL